MDQITLKNFRCFREEQTARLAPLTLLVGENSTGKTSFMAMIRALWDMIYRRAPDFKETPYDLGSFDEIAHFRGGRGGRSATFEGGIKVSGRAEKEAGISARFVHFEATFKKQGTFPVPERMRFSLKDVWTELSQTELSFGTKKNSWKRQYKYTFDELTKLPGLNIPLYFYISHLISTIAEVEGTQWTALSGSGSEQPTQEDFDQISEISSSLLAENYGFDEKRIYASAPVRSKPRRTYDPARSTPDPEGDYIPMYLSSLYFQDKKQWPILKDKLENFGQDAGLFDEISIKPLGKKETEPFQMQVRKFGKRVKGPQRNLIDVGYGVSQVLPVITELLSTDAPPIFLLQQPEVHLHPSAQAALGSLFCQIAGPQRQLVIETHSDYLLDRVRMDVRDGDGNLKPEDVSILFFERRDLDVHIHSIELDDEGNLKNAPPGYRQFFIDEMERSIWKRQNSKES